jgi:hypothetical protein
MIGLELMKKVKHYPFINDYRVYESFELDNRFEVLMLPMAWQYELIEAWYPNTVWNPLGKGIEIMSDSERSTPTSADATTRPGWRHASS